MNDAARWAVAKIEANVETKLVLLGTSTPAAPSPTRVTPLVSRRQSDRRRGRRGVRGGPQGEHGADPVEPPRYVHTLRVISRA